MVHGFISYAHADHGLLTDFHGRLKPDERLGMPDYWADTSLTAGQKWNTEIAAAIARAEIFLLLLTSRFLESEYIYHTELPAIRTRVTECEGLIVPVLLKPCMWEQHLGEYQAVPTNAGRAVYVVDWPSLDHGYHAAHLQLHVALKRHWPNGFGAPA